MMRSAAAILFLLIVAAPAQAEPTQAWAHHIAEASSRFGVPQSWIHRVMMLESGGRATWRGRPIRSRVGAMGLMQLMPATWRAMRATHALGFDPDDPRDNILAGTAYLRAMYDRFGYPGMFAAYNAGPGRYADHLARGTRLPTETVHYLAKVPGRGSTMMPRVRRAVADTPERSALIVPVTAAVASSADRPNIRPDRHALFFALNHGTRLESSRGWPLGRK